MKTGSLVIWSILGDLPQGKESIIASCNFYHLEGNTMLVETLGSLDCLFHT